MRLAVISDIHGECFALEQVLKDIRRQGIEQVVCLGDAVQGGSQPAETVARLRELHCPVVMGNADAWLLTGTSAEGEETSEQQRAVREWSLAQLSESDLAFIQQFQPTLEVALEGGKTLLCFHGSPRSFDEIILPTGSCLILRTGVCGWIPGLIMRLLVRRGHAWASLFVTCLLMWISWRALCVQAGSRMRRRLSRSTCGRVSV